jgi:hypothetical protein
MLELTIQNFSRNVAEYLPDAELNDFVIARNGEPYIKIVAPAPANLRGKYKGVFSTEKLFRQKQADKALE